MANPSEKEKAKIDLLFGVNKELDTNIDPIHAVKCSNGTFVPRVKGDISIFRGIPFAIPPVRENRWKKPLPVQSSDKIFEAYFNGCSAIQTVIDSERASYYPQSEDCLYLNVWINNASKKKDKPIMVFIHGGSYGWGGTVDPLYDGYNFVMAHPDVVLIAISYRLGMFGFIDLSSMEGGENYPDAPNLGILDQIEALRYIKQNGKAFGGDINNVTIFGESAGGGSVSLLPLIKEAKGLFHRVIAESGSVALTYSKEECQILTETLKKLANTSKMDELVKMPIDKLIEINKTLNDINNFPMRDGKLIPLNPYEAYKDNDIKDIDMMIGTNANEMYYWIGELGGTFAYSYGMPIKFDFDLKKIGEDDRTLIVEFLQNVKGHSVIKISEFYNEIMFRLPAIKQAEFHSSLGGNSYMYYWNIQSKRPYFKACHAVELAYVFNNPDETIYIGAPGDKKVAEDISSMWVNFATTGNPSIDNAAWEKYDAEKRATLIIGDNGYRMENDPLGNQREILDSIIPYMINPGYGNIDLSLPFFKKINAITRAIGGSIALKK